MSGCMRRSEVRECVSVLATITSSGRAGEVSLMGMDSNSNRYYLGE